MRQGELCTPPETSPGEFNRSTLDGASATGPGSLVLDVNEGLPEFRLAPEHQHVFDSESNPIYPGVVSSCDVRLCIVKVKNSSRDDAGRQSHPLNEAEFLRKLMPSHQNIVRYFDFTDTHIFMEQCSLGSLEHYLTPEMMPPIDNWTYQLCSAITYLHELGCAHNQLHPRHILVANGGVQLKICDFSRAVMKTSDVVSHDADTSGQSFDVYCLGIMTWFMQHGGRPFPEPLEREDGSPALVLRHVELLAEPGLHHVEFMRMCWSHPSVRPSATSLLDHFRFTRGGSTLEEPRPLVISESLSLIREPGGQPGSNPKLHVDGTQQETKLPVTKFSSINVRLAVVKIPKVWHVPTFFADTPFNLFWNELDFLRSTKILHPNIVEYVAVTEHYIFAELYPLGSLEHYLTPNIKPPVLDWTVQLCSAIAYLHDLGFAHNQLLPCNILVDKNGAELLICDFGTVTLAHLYDEADYPRAPELNITMHQTKADQQEARGDASDVYALGLLIWFMQNGGKEIPNNYVWDFGSRDYGYLDAIHSHLDMLDVAELELADVMRECWAPFPFRPTSQVLLERLREMRRQ